ncbi:squalene/phytoene synthase family protein [Leptolyngbya sp. 15MV]|nr:squalene/phytoene synthase family protein [Leptolyngbya sp. 15MV]
MSSRNFPPSTRRLLDAALDRVEALLETAAALPRLLRSRLRWQAGVTLALGWRLLARLRADDPVLRRVALTRGDFAAAFAALPRGALSDATVVRARVTRAKSSFARGMLVLKGERRRALFAVYGFCRAVDDIADAAMPEAEKRRFLAEWRHKLDTPDCALSRELAAARQGFDLPRAELDAMIAGMETDAAPSLRVADEGALDLYCRRVAGSVGALAVRIFGAPDAHGFGLRLGHTFQLVNILRDADEDAALDRVYVPRSLLDRHGVPVGDAPAIVVHPGFAACCEALAARAQAGFAQAEAELATLDRRLLDRMLARSGHRVTIHEAAPMAGGRARALPDGTDNGTHALLGTNRAALRFLAGIGARDAWVEPEPQGLPILDLEDHSARRVALSPLGWFSAPASRRAVAGASTAARA